ncbi:MAG: MBL fold metallo-hydrolase [Armatimonadetes bacterium]|nr:MBL fold metallo-hydrolase [Akkermansiaceae bacterium]
MNYDGFEIFVLSLGNADSIFIRKHSNGVKTNVLIDGGNSSDGSVVLGVLASLGENHIDHLVCSHHHADHAGGLVEIVKSKTVTIGHAWMHVQELVSDLEVSLSRMFQNQEAFADKIATSKAIQKELLASLSGVPISHPFAGAQIGPLVVLSPTAEFYQRQIERMQVESLQTILNERYARRADHSLAALALKVLTEEAEERDGGLGGEPTSPENEVSTILAIVSPNNEIYLLTADAGVEAFADTVKRYNLEALHWMQIPHHGSRRNLNQDLIDYFRPKTSMISARGSVKHPSKKLVNAVKGAGGKVYATYYPSREPSKGRWTRFCNGTVPQISTSTVPALWDENS